MDENGNDFAKYQSTYSDNWNQCHYVKSFCPNCGGQDILHHEQIVFGNVGRIDNATCNKCGCKF